jgi:hypothetical protein
MLECGLGLRASIERGNMEDDSSNRIDPMQIDENWRDRFPKMGLNRQYIGDGLPLCTDLPWTNTSSRRVQRTDCWAEPPRL